MSKGDVKFKHTIINLNTKLVLNESKLTWEAEMINNCKFYYVILFIIFSIK